MNFSILPNVIQSIYSSFHITHNYHPKVVFFSFQSILHNGCFLIFWQDITLTQWFIIFSRIIWRFLSSSTFANKLFEIRWSYMVSDISFWNFISYFLISNKGCLLLILIDIPYTFIARCFTLAWVSSDSTYHSLLSNIFLKFTFTSRISLFFIMRLYSFMKSYLHYLSSIHSLDLFDVRYVSIRCRSIKYRL